MLIFAQIGQGKVFKQHIQIFIFRDLEDKLVWPSPSGWPAPDRCRRRRLRPGTLDTVILYKVIVAGVHAMAQAAAALMKHRFADVVRGDRHRLAAVDIGHRALINRPEIDCLICAL